MKTYRTFVALLSLLWLSCTSVQHISKMDGGYSVPGKQTELQPDAAVTATIAPYKSQLDERMHEVIANVGVDLVKKQPECTMGNWVVDAMMSGANRDGLVADFAVANYGGMRVPLITTGPLTMGEMYELSPFENMLVIVDVPGQLVDSLFQLIASRDGWPVSSNIRLVISQKKLVSASINGAPIDPAKIYKVAMPDYVADGGDDARFLIALPRIIAPQTQRQALIQYAAETARSGKDIVSRVEGRIVTQ